jgi:hypothetical protein
MRCYDSSPTVSLRIGLPLLGDTHVAVFFSGAAGAVEISQVPEEPSCTYAALSDAGPTFLA